MVCTFPCVVVADSGEGDDVGGLGAVNTALFVADGYVVSVDSAAVVAADPSFQSLGWNWPKVIDRHLEVPAES